MMNIAVIGSREFRDLDKVDACLKSIPEHVESFQVITGGARGVDQRAEQWCKANLIPCEVIRPINPKDKLSYLFRNVEIITRADMIFAFWDQSSRGTKFVIDYAKARGKPLKVISDIQR
jgi:hypothetical protein